MITWYDAKDGQTGWHSLEDIEKEKLAMCHWTLEESKQGLIWTHMRKWADKNNIPAPI